MTKKLEELLDLENLSGEQEETNEYRLLSEDELAQQSSDILDALSNAEKIDYALATVTGINVHDSEMEDIASKAIESYKDLCVLGLNVPDVHAGKIFEVAAIMLKTAMDAKNSKVNRKLKTVELQLKKERLDFDKTLRKPASEEDEEKEGQYDRNELIRIISENSKKITKTTPTEVPNIVATEVETSSDRPIDPSPVANDDKTDMDIPVDGKTVG